MDDLDMNPRLALAASPLFADMSPEGLEPLAQACRPVTVRKDGALYRIGDPASFLYVLLSGHVKRAVTSCDGSERVLGVVSPGEMFGEGEVFTRRPHASFAVALENTRVLKIGSDSVRQAVARDPGLAARVIDALARRQYDMEGDMVARHFRTGSERLLDHLLALAGPGRAEAGETLVSLASSKRVVAACIGISPETLSRALRELSESGLIAVNGRRVLLQNARLAGHRAELSGAPTPARNWGRRLSDQIGACATPLASAVLTASTVQPPCSAVNRAGRQRMLSQRMAKSWLMLGRNVLPARARAMLVQSISQFESQMLDLAREPGGQVSAALDALRDLWVPYRALLGCPSGRGCAGLVFEQSERVLSAAQELTLAVERTAGDPRGDLVNAAGRQRMLSQRMAKLFLLRQWGLGDQRKLMGQSAEEFESTLAALVHSPRGTPLIRAELARVTRRWRLFREVLAGEDGGGEEAALAAASVATASERILEEMDRVVGLYERLAA